MDLVNAVAGWILLGLVQGFWAYLMVAFSVDTWREWRKEPIGSQMI